MLAEFAGRMSLKNQIIIGALADSRPYDAVRYADDAQEVLSDLARASEESAALAEKELKMAAGRAGKGRHQHDYRESDLTNLRRRVNLHAAVAERVTELINDTAYLDDFVHRARDDAWAEISTAIAARLDREWPPVVYEPATPETEHSLRERKRKLRRDLAKLEREHRSR